MEPCCIVDGYLVIRDHIAWVQHIRSVRRYELEDKVARLCTRLPLQFCVRPKLNIGGAPPRSVCVAPIHDHLKRQCMDTLEALFSVPGAEYKGRQQERLGDFGFYMHVSLSNP